MENGESLFGDPFGVAASEDNTIYVTDGERGCIWAVDEQGATRRIITGLNTPSGIALAPDGSLIVAETGAHIIRRISLKDGTSLIVAGKADVSGFADGAKEESLFNAPVGVACANDGTIFVADTYNDRIRRIDTNGSTTTLAGGDFTGFADAENGADARFHTPCNLVLRGADKLIVADTGNHRLREIDLSVSRHQVTTIIGTGEPAVRDGSPIESAFDEPIGLAFISDGTLLVTDAGGSALRRVIFGDGSVHMMTLNAEAVSPQDKNVFHRAAGFRDGRLDRALLRRPSGVGVTSRGRLVFTDTHNRLLRIVAETDGSPGKELSSEEAFALLPDTEAMRRGGEPRWAFDPPQTTREIAATFGEVRGVVAENREAHFHNGLDIPGALGETVRYVRSERMLLPLSVDDVNTARERIRLPTLGYIHVRIGRTHDDKPLLADDRYVFLRDEGGRVREVRVRRGTRFGAGEPVGTLNNQYHVHLIAGVPGGEMNALAALALPGASDTIKPTIMRSEVRFERLNGEEFKAEKRSEKSGNMAASETVVIDDDARIIVRAYDRMDGNLPRRRLGVYALGYQVVRADKTLIEGFEKPLMNVEFQRLPEFAHASIVYAEPSQSGYTPQTIYDYIVTNRVRDRGGAEGVWQASRLAPGDYIVRVIARDFFDNETIEEFAVRIEHK
jgi:hypothetical protein